jgi:hypothetical protein
MKVVKNKILMIMKKLLEDYMKPLVIRILMKLSRNLLLKMKHLNL